MIDRLINGVLAVVLIGHLGSRDSPMCNCTSEVCA
jgi:hypothetical protein